MIPLCAALVDCARCRPGPASKVTHWEVAPARLSRTKDHLPLLISPEARAFWPLPTSIEDCVDDGAQLRRWPLGIMAREQHEGRIVREQSPEELGEWWQVLGEPPLGALAATPAKGRRVEDYGVKAIATSESPLHKGRRVLTDPPDRYASEAAELGVRTSSANRRARAVEMGDLYRR